MRAEGDLWWKDHFSLDALSCYGLKAKAAAEARGLMRLLRLKRGAEILDLCCGAGRHAVLLAETGFRVTGFDIQPELLAAAREAASARGVRLRLARGDMRRLPFRGRFDAAINLFTSFGYFAAEAEDLSALAGARRALKPGGALLMDLLNREWLMRHFTPEFSQEQKEGPVRMALNRLSLDLPRGRLDNRRTLVYRDGRRRETFLSIRVYALTELRRLLAQAGLRFERAFGGLDGRPYGMDAFRMVVLARRPKTGRI